jgi:putative pyruvate formate lyase activating enzyme
VHNLNFVTPDHFWPHVKALVHALRGAGVTCPFIYNCSGYQSPSLVAEIAERIDIFLPDLKFAEPDLARVCLGDPRYPDLALASIREMVRCRGFLDPWDPSGAEPARRGVLVRHLVMPGHVQNSIPASRCPS